MHPSGSLKPKARTPNPTFEGFGEGSDILAFMLRGKLGT